MTNIVNSTLPTQNNHSEKNKPDGVFVIKQGKTNYKVKVFFDHSSGLTAEDRLKRIIQAEAEGESEWKPKKSSSSNLELEEPRDTRKGRSLSMLNLLEREKSLEGLTAYKEILEATKSTASVKRCLIVSSNIRSTSLN